MEPIFYKILLIFEFQRFHKKLMICNFICERIAIFVLRLNIWCVYEHYLQSYALIFIQCALQNFTVKWWLQLKLNTSVLFHKKNNIPTGRLNKETLLIGSFMSCTVESPLALTSTNTRIDMSSYSFMNCLLDTEYHRGLELSLRRFLLLGYLSQLILMITQTSHVGIKSRESQGHSKTDIPLISRICFADLGLIQRTLPLLA